MTNDILTSTFINFRDKFLGLASRIVGTSDADDIIHDAFCRLWSRHRLIADETQALKLSYTAVKNSAIDALRRSNVRPTVSLDDSPTPFEADDGSCQQDEQRQTYEAIVNISRQVLNQRQFEVFELHDIKGVDYEDIAEILDMKIETVRTTLSRARKTIRNVYKKTYDS